MNTKTLVSILAVVILASLHLAEAQQPTKIPRIGYQCASSSGENNEEAFRQGLRELGYVEGQNIAIEYRYAEGKLDRASELATELVRLKLDVIVVVGGDAQIQ